MQTIEERREAVVDRKGWPAGEWDGEPDFKQWRDEATGLPCLIVRNRMGAWCGYVGVSTGHPAFKKGCDDVYCEVHGGLTYSAHCAGGICHTVEAGEDDNVWWLGFDCIHSGDVAPKEMMLDCWRGLPGMGDLSSGYGSYKNMDYVTLETLSLAEQLKAMR